MRFKGILYFLFLIVSNSHLAFGQDAHFSQYLNADVYLNPALTSSYRTPAFSLNYRNQWSSIVAPYSTAQVTAIKPLYLENKIKIGALSASFFHDKSGDGILKELGGNVNASYNLRISTFNSIYFGIQLGFVQKSLNYDQLTWGNQYTASGFDPNKDAEAGVQNFSKVYPDVSAGIVYSFNPDRDYSRHGAKYSSRIGLSLYHLNNPNESFYYEGITSRLPVLIKAHGDVEVDIGNNFYIVPNVLFQAQKGIYQVNSGLNISYRLKHKVREGLKPNRLLAGSSYRFKDSFIFLAGLGNQFYTLGFSYDLTTTFVREFSYNTGAYEVSLKISPFKEKKTTSYFYYHRKL